MSLAAGLEPLHVEGLPSEVLALALAQLPHADDIARAAATCHALASAAEHAMWLRAGAAPPAPPPTGETSWLQYLCWLERRAEYTRARARADGSVCASAVHSLLLTSKGGGCARSFGVGTGGRLGHGDDETCRQTPEPVAALCDAAVVALASGADFSLALHADGTVFVFGGALGRAPAADGAQPLAAAPKVATLPRRVGGLYRVRTLAAGAAHALAADADGAVWAWGDGGGGRLGLGDCARRCAPTRLRALDDARVRAASLAAGGEHSLIVGECGTLWACGTSPFGALGLGATVLEARAPARVALPAGARAVSAAAGEAHSLAIIEGGHGCAAWRAAGRGRAGIVVVAFGCGWHGRLGLGGEAHAFEPTAVAGGALAPARSAPPAVAISAGGAHSLAALADGSVLSWGFGWAGQLGHGDEATLLAPRCIDGALPLGARATAVAAGANHSLARCADGAFYSWGSGLGGRLGRAGSDRRERRPVRLDYLDS